MSAIGVGLIQLSLAPFPGDLRETLSPGLEPRAESSCPFRIENPLRNLKLMLMGSCRTATEDRAGLLASRL